MADLLSHVYTNNSTNINININSPSTPLRTVASTSEVLDSSPNTTASIKENSLTDHYEQATSYIATLAPEVSNINIYTPYVGDSNCSGTSMYDAASGTAIAGEAPYCLPRVVPSADFVNTLRSDGKESNGHSPPKHTTMITTTAAVTNRRHGSYCDCLAGGAGCGGGLASSGKTAVTFWPALLANLGILGLLLFYILLGSVIFLTIENSNEDKGSYIVGLAGRGSIPGGEDGSMDAVETSSWHFAQTPQTAAVAAEKPQRFGVEAPKDAKPEVATQVHKYDSTPRINKNNDNHTYNNTNMHTMHTKGHIEKSSIETAVPTALASTYSLGNSFSAPSLSASAHSAVGGLYPFVTKYLSASVAAEATATKQAATNKKVFNGASVQTTPEQETYMGSVHDKYNTTATTKSAPLDYELQTLSLTEFEEMDVLGSEGAADTKLQIDEEVERQRTVDNIWDITVSLNILYKENWTKLAALEIAKFQDQIVKRFVMDLTLPTASEMHSTANAAASASATPPGHNILQQSAAMQNNGKSFNRQQQQQHAYWQLLQTRQRLLQQRRQQQKYDKQKLPFKWNFATAFLYSLTVITTVGYGTITSRTTCGRIVTIIYATFGIPLTLVYLSSMGGMLARLLRTLCTRLLCCCFCKPQTSGCGGFSRQQQIGDRKCDLKLKKLQQKQQSLQHQQRKPLHHQQQQLQQQQLLPYCYVRPPADMLVANTEMSQGAFDTLSVTTTTATDSRHSITAAHVLSWSLVVSAGLCTLMLLAYICLGAIVMARLEQWTPLDSIYFCFMSLTTIGFCDLLPGLSRASVAPHGVVWFCAFYILSGLTLTSVCFNMLHEEILLRMRVVVKFQKVPLKGDKERGFYGAPPP